MPRSFSLRGKWNAARLKEPRVALRAVAGALLVANLAAAVVAWKPFGGSEADLRRRASALQAELTRVEARVARARALVAKVETARAEGDQFQARYVTGRRTTFSVVQEELNRIAKEAGIKPREASIVLEPIEGSDTLSMMTINAGYEGSYANLAKFVNLLDKSPRFLIIESMTATPQSGGANLTVSLKLDTFVKEEPGSPS
jgi:type IV pilus assembly protein PilO